MKTLRFLLLLLISNACFAQPKVTRLDNNTIPGTILFNGHVVNAVRWTDSLGDNIVITTETGETASKGMDADTYRDTALYAHHYLLQGGAWIQTWKVYDFIKECPVDLKANFIKNTFAVTDLDKNGKAEVWLMYKTVCHGDVSPSNMKIIMYEDNRKHAVRGTNKVQVSANEYEGGTYVFDDAFKKASEAFRQYASQLWKKNIMETWE